MTEKQKQQFNAMRGMLLHISKNYQTPTQLRKGSEKQFGLEYEEALEMAYESIQDEARMCVKGIKAIN